MAWVNCKVIVVKFNYESLKSQKENHKSTLWFTLKRWWEGEKNNLFSSYFY